MEKRRVELLRKVKERESRKQARRVAAVASGQSNLVKRIEDLEKQVQELRAKVEG